jgi:chromosome segregation ATPase
MTELEQQLSSALTRLSTQYAGDMERLAKQNLHLQEQVQALAGQMSSLATRLDDQTKGVATLTAAYNKLATAWRGELN